MPETQPPIINPELRPTMATPPTNKSRAPKKVYLGLGIVLVVGVGLALTFMLHRKKSSNTTIPHGTTATQQKAITTNSANEKRIRLIATGDFIAHDTLNAQAKKADGSYDYLQFMSDFKPIFAAADVRFCNQATVSGGQPYGISGYPVFNAPTQFAHDMGSLGCNLINTASNHSFDKGQGAIDATLNVWDGIPNLLSVAGENRSAEEQSKIRYFTVKNVKFAFLAYTTYSNAAPSDSYGVNTYSQAFAKSQIDAAKRSGAQIIIVSMRWGTEYSPDINGIQTQESQFLADQGVSLVLGHGPHVLEPVKRLKGASGNETLVWYSLGNFINTQEPVETLFNGLAVVDFDTSTKQITAASYLPIYMHYEWTADQKAHEDLLARHNLHLYLLEDADAAIARSQLGTSSSAQKDRISKQLNRFTTIPLITSKDYYK